MSSTKEIATTTHPKSVARRSLFFQPKLTINSPNDVYEQEADAMAEKVTRMSTNENSFFRPATKSIQRKCAECEKAERQVQRKENAASPMDGKSNSGGEIANIQRQEKDTNDPKLQITKKIELPPPQDKLPSVVQQGNKDAEKDKPHLGIDFSKGISANPPLFLTPDTYAFTLVYRDFDLESFGEDDPFGVDVGLHEPNFQLLLSPDPHNRVIYQAAFTLINLHFRRNKQEFIEIGLSPQATYSQPSGTLAGGAQVQVELHVTSRFSITASTAISASKHDDKAPIDYSSVALGTTKGYDWSWNPVSVGMVWHFK